MILFNDQFRKGLDSNLAGIDLVIGAKGSPLQLVLNSMYHIDNPTGNISLSEAGPFLNPSHPLIAKSIPLSLGDSYGAYRIVGAPPSILSLYKAEKIKGDIYEKDFDAVIGQVVAEKLHLDLGDQFHSTHGLIDNPDFEHDHETPFTITGILKSGGTVLDQLILCTPQTIWKIHEHDSTTQEEHHEHVEESESRILQPAFTGIDSIRIKSMSDSIIIHLRSNPDKEITSILIDFRHTNVQTLNFPRNINQNTGLMAASPVQEIIRLTTLIGSGAEAIRYLALLIAIVAAVSIFISLYTSLKERQYEMALMRVSGAGPGKILFMILGEGLWISFLGLVFGLMTGHIGMWLAGDILEKSYRYQFTGWIFVDEEIFVIISAFAIGILASIIPAIRGSGTELHRTLAEN